MTRETVAGVVLASFATSEMVGWAKVLETITHDRDCVNARQDCFNGRGDLAAVHVHHRKPASGHQDFASVRPPKDLTCMGLTRNLAIVVQQFHRPALGFWPLAHAATAAARQ